VSSTRVTLLSKPAANRAPLSLFLSEHFDDDPEEGIRGPTLNIAEVPLAWDGVGATTTLPLTPLPGYATGIRKVLGAYENGEGALRVVYYAEPGYGAETSAGLIVVVNGETGETVRLVHDRPSA
jgi:hypothetical protein